MIEQAMIFALGFLTAGLLALAATPAFWRRAERLSMRRLEMMMPLSPREVVAERDALRAQFAVEARRMERVGENAAARLAAAQGELGHEIGRGVDLQTALTALEGRHAEQATELARSERERHVAEAGQAATEKALHDADAMAADRARRLAERDRALAATERLAEERRASLSAAEARIAGLAAHIESLERMLETGARDLAERDRKLAEAEHLSAEQRTSLSSAEGRIDGLGARLEGAERTLKTQDQDLAEMAELKTAHSALRLKADASAHALAEMRPELERLRRLAHARNAADLADIADLDDPRLRLAIHDLGTTIARLAAPGHGAPAADARAETPAA